MPATLESLGIDRLSPDEQLDLVHAIWNHIAANRPRPMLTDAQRVDLQRRVEEDNATPDDTVSWGQVKAEARCRLESRSSVMYRVPLVFYPQPEGGYTVTSPLLPELVTEGDTLDEAYANARDAMAAVVELYEDDGRELPSGVLVGADEPIRTDVLVEAA